MPILIEGIVGVGKSYVCDKLKSSNRQLRIQQEEVESDWKSSALHSMNVLQARYQSSTASASQMYILLSFSDNSGYDICERSIHSAYHVFSKKYEFTSDNDKIMDDCYYKFYRSVVRRQKDDVIIFLDVKPEVALANIKTRGRKEETSLTLEDLKKMRAQYLQMLERLTSIKIYVAYDTSSCIRLVRQLLNAKARYIRN